MSEIKSEITKFGSPLPEKFLSNDLEECHLEILRLRDEKIGLQAELVEVKHRIEMSIADSDAPGAYSIAGLVSNFENQVLALSNEIALIRSSRTWRVGHLMLLPVRIVKKILGKTKW